MTTTHRYEDDDDDNIDSILKDGEVLRVPLRLMDSYQRSVYEHFHDAGRLTCVTDAAGGTIGLHRPGFRVADGVVRDTSHYDAYERDLTTAWKQDVADPPNRQGRDSMPVRDEREQAYADYETRIQNAWRTGS